jgi:Spy/CpxP family protein refolding chaperone
MRAYADAFAEVPLRDGQRAEIERLLMEAQTRHEAMLPARAELSAAIAAQMQSGAIDRAALAPKFEALAAERAKSEPLDHAAMEHVHALLDASQRAALVAVAETKMHAEHHGERGAQGPHDMKRMGDELNLTEEQRGKIRDAMMARRGEHRGEHEGAAADAPEHRGGRGDHRGGHHGGPMGELKAHWERLAAAFKSDHFVMSELAPLPGDPRRAMGEHMLDMIEVALPVLTPEQRHLAAAKLLERARRGEEPAAH